MIHSASSGPKTGVIISSLSEKYWANHYFACGRIITDSTINQIEDNDSTSDIVVDSALEQPQIKSKSEPNSIIAFDFTGYLDWTFLNLPENETKNGEYSFVNEFRIRGFAL